MIAQKRAPLVVSQADNAANVCDMLESPQWRDSRLMRAEAIVARRLGWDWEVFFDMFRGDACVSWFPGRAVSVLND